MKTLYVFLIAIFLYVSGIAQNITLFKDLNPGGGDAGFINPTLINNKLYFAANNGTAGIELWVCDGTVDGTYMIKDINPGAEGSFPNRFVAYNGKVYFDAFHVLYGRELWVTDGTADGTQLVKDINPGIESSNPLDMTVAIGKIYFQASDGFNGIELWASDGTEIGTELIADINEGPADSHAQQFIELNGRVIFGAFNNVHNAEPFVSDGTAVGTYCLKDIEPGPQVGAGFNDPVFYNGKIYFLANAYGMGNEWWYTDGTPEGTSLLMDIYPGIMNGTGILSKAKVYNGLLHFGAMDSNGNGQLWRTGGSLEGTVQITHNEWQLAMTHPDLRYAFEFNDRLYYYQSIALDGGRLLWSTDGTSLGTELAAPSPEGNYNWCMFGTPKDDTLYYVDRNPGNNQLHIWKSAGNSATAQMIPHLPGGMTDAISYSEYWLGNVNGTVIYYGRHDWGIGRELYTIGEAPVVKVEEATSLSTIKLYPNPAKNTLRIALGERQPISIYNATGMLIEQQIANTNHVLDVSNYPAGIYIIKSHDEVVRFIKE